MAKDQVVLQTSADPPVLSKTAVEFAASASPVDQAVLLRFLNSNASLLRLDTMPEMIRTKPKNLRLAKVIKTLMDSPAPVSKDTLVALAKGGDFISLDPRQWLLITALVVIRPSPPEAVAFWDSQSKFDSIFAGTVIEALCDNASEPAIALLEKKFADPKHTDDAKKSWMHTPVLVHRNDLPLLKACFRLLSGGLKEELRSELVYSLCGYNEKWYMTCARPKPPLRAAAAKPALEQFRDICLLAKDKLTLEPLARAALEQALLELKALGIQT